jgi:hypothetical protein
MPLTKARTNQHVIQSEAKDPTQWRDRTIEPIITIDAGDSLLKDQGVFATKTILVQPAQNGHATPDLR